MRSMKCFWPDYDAPPFDQFIATYNRGVASYRQSVLAAFQQVEDNLA